MLNCGVHSGDPDLNPNWQIATSKKKQKKQTVGTIDLSLSPTIRGTRYLEWFWKKIFPLPTVLSPDYLYGSTQYFIRFSRGVRCVKSDPPYRIFKTFYCGSSFTFATWNL